jgi:hypothetical protein
MVQGHGKEMGFIHISTAHTDSAFEDDSGVSIPIDQNSAQPER